MSPATPPVQAAAVARRTRANRYARRADDPGQLAHRRGVVLDVAQQVGEGQPVEARVGEWQRLRLACRSSFTPELVGAGEAPTGSRPASRGSGRCHDRAATACQARQRPAPCRSPRRARAPARRHYRPHERSPPAGILTEAEQRREQVIATRQPTEQLHRLALDVGVRRRRARPPKRTSRLSGNRQLLRPLSDGLRLELAA